ncbi:hypothetical protein FEM48_Zijuj01G0207300 [Ziziphus jujuba var. spinosa]|uniref:Uncharacterized protein n=1 Tax=Ziziphus jujuba var. spinosa TaxID=714518 RepID=A0A978W3G5_ZIZJJ|nr:hypothetical protein FEM48_Zijuj01G0207300 [Ziziphus jujuba var. spinosa]
MSIKARGKVFSIKAGIVSAVCMLESKLGACDEVCCYCGSRVGVENEVIGIDIWNLVNDTNNRSRFANAGESTFHVHIVENKTWRTNDERLPGKGWINNATKLTFVGIELGRKSSSLLLDLEFHGHALEIPTLFLDDGFGPFMVDTTNDINIIHNARVIKQAKGGNNEILQLFNNLIRELEFDMEDCYITEQVERINFFCRRPKARIKTKIQNLIVRFDILSGALS